MARNVIARKMVPLILLLFLLALAATQLIGGCSDAYDTPSTTATPTALISAETLKDWIDAGKVNGVGVDRVVILDINSIGNYTAGHIPGARFVDSAEIYQTRREGPANDANEVLDGTHMNAFIRKYGIDDKTTMVFTAGTATTTGMPGSYLAVTRTYWMFRYWGFAKERLKVLDGINAAWSATYGLATAPPPAVSPSTYSVTSNRVLRADLRTSLSELIDAAEGNRPNSQVVDFRSGESNNSFAGQRGKTAGLFTALSGTVSLSDAVVFEGHVKGARAMDYTTMFDSANGYRFKSASELVTMLTDSAGLNSTMTALVH